MYGCLVPSRYRLAAEAKQDPEEQRAEPAGTSKRQQLVGLPPPKVPKPKRDRSTHARESSPCSPQAEGSCQATPSSATHVPAVQHGAPEPAYHAAHAAKAKSIMELVSEAAKQAEAEAAMAAARRAAASAAAAARVAAAAANRAAAIASGTGTSSGSELSTPTLEQQHKEAVKNSCHRGGSSSSAAGAPHVGAPLVPNKDSKAQLLIPRSPTAKPGKAAAAVQHDQCQAAAAAAMCTSPKTSGSSTGTVPHSPRADQQQQLLQQHLDSSKTSSFDQQKQIHFSAGSECGSDDGHLGSAASLVSSSSSSSLCSNASYSSNASTISRPKPILLNRTSSCGSVGSSPRYGKRVTWKDGQANEVPVGSELVAVRVLDDTPEIRKMRRDTWPERPGARRDALDQAEAEAEAAVKEQQQEERQHQAATGLVVKLLQEPTKLLDWREKLKQLQADRRQQRMAQVQASWEAQQHKLARQENHQQQQQQTEYPSSSAAAVAAADDADVDMDCTKSATCVTAGSSCCSAISISAVAVS